MSVRQKFIDCIREGKVIASYPVGIPIGLLPGAPVDMRALEDGAKTQLTNDGIAFPPWEGITFGLRDPN